MIQEKNKKKVVDKILPYLKSNPRKGLLFRKENTLTLKIYADTDYTH